ncbi:hypothetical protein ACFQ1E_05535 [Sphingomonas canadensis]|uniref:General secretion pathway protein N n=1 Tax=Sphingomonas canadensis TaxID=1219257 RepID=A0ABW3H2Y7_9SPHN|nr:hypothetical protein [Sphingomonas canadensis]MCW3835750.1 hypothetical protein [Sphingomonas canadensis]
MPAGVVFKNHPWRSGVSGTVWSGSVGVNGMAALHWQWAPLRSIAGLGFAADWQAEGPGMALAGRALAGPGSVAFDKVEGTANAALLDVVQPGLPFACDLAGQLSFDRVVARGAERMLSGRALSEPGSCRARAGGAATAMPALVLTAEKTGAESRIRVAPAAQRLKTLIDARLKENGTLAVTVTDEGARAMPFLGARGGTTIEGRM